MQDSRTRKILIFALVFVGAFFIYTFFFTGNSSKPVLNAEKPLLQQENVKGKELLKVLLSLNNIKLDEEIFSSSLFASLEDFTIVLPDIGVSGRKNPFAPIGLEEFAAPSSQKTTRATTSPPKVKK